MQNISHSSASIELLVSSLHQEVYSFYVPILKPQNILCVLCWAVWAAGKLEDWLISPMVMYVIIISILLLPWNICIQRTQKKSVIALEVFSGDKWQFLSLWGSPSIWGWHLLKIGHWRSGWARSPLKGPYQWGSISLFLKYSLLFKRAFNSF